MKPDCICRECAYLCCIVFRNHLDDPCEDCTGVTNCGVDEGEE